MVELARLLVGYDSTLRFAEAGRQLTELDEDIGLQCRFVHRPAGGERLDELFLRLEVGATMLERLAQQPQNVRDLSVVVEVAPERERLLEDDLRLLEAPLIDQGMAASRKGGGVRIWGKRHAGPPLPDGWIMRNRQHARGGAR